VPFAKAGMPVSVLELAGEALERGLSLVRSHYDGSVARGSLTRERAERALALIQGVTEYPALGTADIVIEAVFEDLKVKQEVFARLDQAAAPHAILATNTSSLDIDAIAASTSRPQQVVGTHFFSPANVMKLLENVRGQHTSPQTIATVMALARTLGKIAVLAGNCDGFIGNRMLMFYGAEAEFLLEEGATPEQIDRVMEDFGFAMGPLAVRDLAGNDVGLAIRKGRRLPPDERRSPILERLVGEGRLGQKAGKGFYRYEGRTRIPDAQVLALIEAVSRDLGMARAGVRHPCWSAWRPPARVGATDRATRSPCGDHGDDGPDVCRACGRAGGRRPRRARRARKRCAVGSRGVPVPGTG